MELCRALVADGVHTVVATPHQLGRYREVTTRARVEQAIEDLRAELRRRDIALQVLPGADVRIDERLHDLLATGEVFTIAGAGRYLLLEMPHEVFIDATRLVHALHAEGLRVVLTHPERYTWIRRHLAQMLQWRSECGALLQITAGSLTGDFGEQVESIAWQMAERAMIDVVASDAHSVDGRRRPRMSAARDLVTQRLGTDLATQWFQTAPQELITPKP